LLDGTDNVIMFNTGLRWTAIDGLVFDVAAGSRISGHAPDLTATAGLTWTFGFVKEEGKQEKNNKKGNNQCTWQTR